LPEVERVSSYCLPRNLRRKSVDELRELADAGLRKRVFLADGDALVLPTRRLLAVLQAIREHLPEVERVSSYCLPRNLRRKSVDELRELADAGLR
ncbi:hypothetical protein ACLXAZ_33315, partial [Escherichia coli]